MSGQVFALLIGVDKYKAGNIWNLNVAVDDARSIERWLTNDLQVPRDHICTLIDSQATKRNIEERFLSHFVNNPAIEPGDALIFYYAGHGSSIRAPPGWFDRGHGDVSVLCTYDYDTKLSNGKTNAGISDRSMHAMLRDLAQVKGDNITLILDTCFCLPPTDTNDPKERRYTRYTPTRKATREDLLAGLWPSVSPQKSEPLANRGFTGLSFNTHVALAASAAGWPATERKDGGNFTRALLALKDTRSLHKLTYADLPSELASFMGDHQHAACAGANVDRILFDGIPFGSDDRFVPASARDGGHVQVAAGEMHGVAVGTEFALHAHNRRGSLNGSIGSYVATQVYPTWCLARPKTPAKHAGHHHIPREGWARITRWNNSTSLRVHVRGSLSSFFRRASLNKKVHGAEGVGIVREDTADDADLSVRLRQKAVIAEHRDPLIPANGQKKTRVSMPIGETGTDTKAIESTARLHTHLYRKHPAKLFATKVSICLCRVDLYAWTRAGGDLLVEGGARFAHSNSGNKHTANGPAAGDDHGAREKAPSASGGHIYVVALSSYPDTDLWSYLACTDAGWYSISLVHHAGPSSCPLPPHKKHSRLLIGPCSIEFAVFSFRGRDGTDYDSGFLKLFVSATHILMIILERGSLTAVAA